MPPEPSFAETANAAIPRLASALARLDPGDLARLRRMDPDGPGEAAFWQLVAELKLPGNPERWLRFSRLIALLTPRGDPHAGKPSAHDGGRTLGAALAEAGFSEMRLLRLIERAPDARPEALERMVRFLGARGAGAVDCREIFWLLHGTGPDPSRRLANHYFRTLARTAPQGEAA